MTKIQLRHDTSTRWQAANPILAPGEVGVETDTQKIKVGNGINSYNSLSYVGNTIPSNMVTTNTNQTISGDKTFSAHDIILYATEASTLAKIRGRYGTGTIDIINPTGSTYSGPCFGNTAKATRLESSSSVGIEVVADRDAQNPTTEVSKVIHTGNMLGCITAGDNISITSIGSGRNRQMVISSTGGTVPTNMVTTDTSQTITAAKTFNSSITIGDDILTAQGYRIANGGLGADMLSLGDSNASMALYSNGEIQVTTSSSGVNTLLHTGNLGSYAATTTQGIKLWKGTQTDYDSITTKDANTLYIITGA